MLGALYRRLSNHLSYQRRRKSRLAEFHHCLAHRLVLGDKSADADSALRVALRHRVNQHHILLYALQVHGRDIGAARVDELTIHLVAEQVEVIFLHQVAYLVHLLLRVEVSRRVVGVANQYCLRALVDKFLKLLHLGQAEPLVDSRSDGAYHRSRRDGETHIVGVGGLRHYYLVAGVKATQESEQHRLRSARGDDYLAGREMNLIALVVSHQRLAQRAVALRRAILQRRAVDGLQHLQRLWRCGQVRLSDIQPIYLYAAVFRSLCQGCQLADGRSGHLHSSM